MPPVFTMVFATTGSVAYNVHNEHLINGTTSSLAPTISILPFLSFNKHPSQNSRAHRQKNLKLLL